MDIRFTQSDISPFFSDGTPVGKTVDALRAGEITPEQVGSPIRVVNVDGTPFSMDNRRLAAFSLGGQTDIPIELVDLESGPILSQQFYDRFDPIDGEGYYTAVATRAQRVPTQQLLFDLGKINGHQLGY